MRRESTSKPHHEESLAQRRGARPSIVFDDTHWPLLLVRFFGTPSEQDFEHYLDQLGSMLKRRQRHVVVLDSTEAHFTPVSQQRMQAAWIRAHRDELRELSAGTAFVVSSRLFRLVLAGVFMLQPLPTPYALFATVAESILWGADQLGIDPPVPGLTWDLDETTRRNRKT